MLKHSISQDPISTHELTYAWNNVILQRQSNAPLGFEQFFTYELRHLAQGTEYEAQVRIMYIFIWKSIIWFSNAKSNTVIFSMFLGPIQEQIRVERAIPTADVPNRQSDHNSFHNRLGGIFSLHFRA